MSNKPFDKHRARLPPPVRPLPPQDPDLKIVLEVIKRVIEKRRKKPSDLRY